MDQSTFVIVGGGISGVICAQSLGVHSPESTVTLITASPTVKSTTNLLFYSKNLFQFDVEEREASFLNEFPNLKIIQDVVKEVEPGSKTVVLESGHKIGYEKLCLCTGARPKLIVKNKQRVIGIRDTESVSNLVQKLQGARKVVIVGNGGIATELVHEIEGVEIVWVIKDSHISATFVDPGAAEFFQLCLAKKSESETEKSKEKKEPVKRLRYTVEAGSSSGPALGPDWHQFVKLQSENSVPKNLQVEYQTEVLEVSENNSDEEWPVLIKLSNGKSIGCDLVVSATGVIPNSDLKGLENLKKGEDGGFLVDWKMETSQKDIYAVGDVCSAGWELARHWFQMRLWTQAYQMGMYVAKSMMSSLKNEEFYQDFCFELFTHCTKFFGFKVVLLGLYNGQKLEGKYEVLLRVTKDVEYVKLVMVDGKLQGAVLIGETDLEEMCENLILNQLDLSVYGEDLLNPDIDIEDYFD